MSPGIRISKIAVDGVQSVVREVGSAGDREAAVFVHGNPGSGEDWSALLGEVGDFARAIAPDMPGYGKADRPAHFDYSIRGYARHLGGVIDGLGIDRAHLVLHDFGGPWGMAWAADNLKRVASLTLINIGILPGYRWHKYARIWRTPVLGEIFVAVTTRTLWRFFLDAENPKPFDRTVSDRMFDDLDGATKRAMLKLYRATPDLGKVTSELGAVLSKLDEPVSVLWGSGDASLPVRYAEKQREFFPHAQVHVLEGCGHWPFVDDPQRVAAIVVPFLRASLRRSSLRIP